MHAFPPRCRAQFEPVRLIASGGFGSVHLARQLALDRHVAIKLLDPARLADKEEVARFLDEAKVTATLTHPGIVVLIDHDVEDGQPWIAYEYVPGRTLRAILDAGPLDVPRALSAVRQVAEALQAAHERGVIHRDIKPANVLEVEDGRYKVADFGIAKWSAGSVHTQDGMILGTPAYLAPEQIVGDVPAPATDLYALGVVLHELLSGHTPFGGEVSALSDHINTPPPPIPREGVPAPVQNLVYRLLAKSPGDRPASAGELSIDISRIIESLVVTPEGTVRLPRGRESRPVSFAVAPPPPDPRRATYAAAALVFALGLTAAGMVALRPGGRGAGPRPSPSPTVPAPFAAIVAQHLPGFERTLPLDRHQAALIAKTCLGALIEEDPRAGPAALPDVMCWPLLEMLAARFATLDQAVHKLPLMSDAQTREYAQLVRLATDVGDAVFEGRRPFPMEQAFARSASWLFTRRLLNFTIGNVERPLVDAVARWRARRPDAIAPRMLEISYDLESGKKPRVAPRGLELLATFARVHLPPAGPEPDAALFDEWCRLVYEVHGNAFRAGARAELADIANMHARELPRFGALIGRNSTMRQQMDRKLRGLPK